MDFGTREDTMTPIGEKPQLAELEAENGRLQRLVADLLVKNQQLRVELKAAQRSPNAAPRFPTLSMN